VTVARTPAPARSMSSVRNFEVKGTRLMHPSAVLGAGLSPSDTQQAENSDY
jgi:hypothetical protein